MKAGLQLYNFRKELKNDFQGTMREIAKLGFDGVEFATFYGDMEPAEIAAFLKELKLECAGTMFKPEEIRDPGSKVYDYARVLKSPGVTHSIMTDFVAGFDAIKADIAAAGRAAWQNGFVFAYHNHWREFELIDGVPAMEKILAETDPVCVKMEADICWINRGGLNPPAFLRKYRSRINQLHVKDITVPDDTATTTELGKGVVDVKGSVEAAREIGIEWLIYEQDNSADPFRSAAESLKTLRALMA